MAHPSPTQQQRRRDLILASGSRYRQELLERLQLDFSVIVPAVDESSAGDETPRALAERLALAKAEAVAARHPEAVVIGSDQAATLDGRDIVGKPGTHERAVAQLRSASGRAMHFHTAVAVVCAASGHREVVTVPTTVHFRPLSDELIEAYLRAETPYDCAGSAKCEGLGASLLESIDGPDPSALIGLPLIELCQMLARAGIAVLPGIPS